MKIEIFDKTICKALRDVMQRALSEAGIEGVEFEVGGMAFSGTECNIRVSAKTAGNAAERSDKAENMAKLYGLASTEAADGTRLVEFHAKKHKYPFIVVKPNGKRFKLTLEQARQKFSVTA